MLGCIGFTHKKRSWIWHMIIVRGKHCYWIPLIYPLYYIMYFLYKRSTEKRLKNYGTSKNIRN